MLLSHKWLTLARSLSPPAVAAITRLWSPRNATAYALQLSSVGQVVSAMDNRQGLNFGPHRLWLHTCDLDHSAALPNYLKAGFTICKERGRRAGIVAMAMQIKGDRLSVNLSASAVRKRLK